jgi:multisubunit Na+/H+ antiporter MnhF subunit
MELLKVVKRRSLLSESVYVLLNVGLAVAVLAVIWATGTPWLALLLVLLSKWRVLAVRPRYWFAHVEANMVDMIVSLGLVVLMYLVGQLGSNHAAAVQIFLAILYAAWLLLLKPRTRRSAVALQAAAAVVVGTMALFSISYEWPSSMVVIFMWIIGYSAARHVFMAFSDEDTRFLSLVWGFVTAEIGWLAFHWTIAYTLPFAGGLKLPQATLLLLGISFLAERVYDSYHRHGVVRFNDIALPMLLVLGVIFILLTLFNAAGIGAV